MAATQSDVMHRVGRHLTALTNWIDARFPMTKLLKEHATEYYASKNFNFWYGFGVLATVVIALQIVSGILLTMNYKPSAAEAFASVEYIMRDVEWGWFIRYLHSTGGSALQKFAGLYTAPAALDYRRGRTTHPAKLPACLRSLRRLLSSASRQLSAWRWPSWSC